MPYTDDSLIVETLKKHVDSGNISEDSAYEIAEDLHVEFSILKRQRIEISVIVELEPEDYSDADELAANVASRVESAVRYEYGGCGSTHVEATVESVEDAE